MQNYFSNDYFEKSNDIDTIEKEQPIEEVKALETIFVNEFTDILNPDDEMLGPVRDGGTIIANIPPGNWGPMITPNIRGGQEVTKPIYIQGAEVGDALIVEVKSIQVTSFATSSGLATSIPERYIGDPYLNVKCPGCGKLIPNTYKSGIGKGAIRCETCHTETSPFEMTSGYTMVFDDKHELGVTVSKEGARKIASKAEYYMRIPENSKQNEAVILAPTDISGNIARVRAFLSQLGTMPSIAMPENYNAGDVGLALVDAPHEYAITKEQLINHATDGNLNINKLRQGSMIICPVKVQGGGLYLGGLVAALGEGTLAGADVSGIVQVQVKVLKRVNLDGPILLPNNEDLSYTLKPFTKKERELARDIGEDFGVKQFEETYPLSFIGSGENINDAIENGYARASQFLEMSAYEIKNRASITGSVEIGRLPGIAIVSLQVPKSILKKKQLYKMVKQHYRQ